MNYMNFHRFPDYPLALYVRISIAVYGKYRAALRHIDCALGANIERALHAYFLFATKILRLIYHGECQAERSFFAF